MSKKRSRKARKAKKGHPAKKRCQGCHEDDLKVVPVVVTVDGRRIAKWELCRACAAGKVMVLNPWVKK